MEYLATDVNNIKESLCRIGRYILKKIEQGKANSIDNLKGVGEIAWNFLLSLYEAGWDELIADNKNFSFRHKVKMQFNQPPNSVNISRKGKNVINLALISSLPSPILAKSPKMINTVTKYFKKPNNKKEKSYILRLWPPHLTLLGKFLRSKNCFLNYKTRKLNTSRRLSLEMAN